jgi:hypothetical protein
MRKLVFEDENYKIIAASVLVWKGLGARFFNVCLP